MREQSIATEKRRIVLRLADGGTLEGEVFLSLYEAHRDGPQRLGDLLNGGDRFLPVQTDRGVLLVNLARIVSARTRAAEEADDLMRLGERYRVRVTTLQQEEIAADLFVNLPQSHRRVKDCLNLPQPFLTLFVGEEVFYVNTDYILYVQD